MLEFGSHILKWVESAFAEHGLIWDVVIIGSYLLEPSKANDIDLLIHLSICSKADLRAFAAETRSLARDFLMRFSKPLHITVFSSNESSKFVEFLGLCSPKMVIK